MTAPTKCRQQIAADARRDVVFNILADACRLGRICPSFGEIGDVAGGKPDTLRNDFRVLEKAGRIVILGNRTHRIVKIGKRQTGPLFFENGNSDDEARNEVPTMSLAHLERLMHDRRYRFEDDPKACRSEPRFVPTITPTHTAGGVSQYG